MDADDKFCIGCGKPLNAAPAAAPQKQKQRPKTKPAAPQVKKRKPVTVPAAPQVKKRKPVTVPAAPQVKKRKPVTAPNISWRDVKQYQKTAPSQLHCGRCMHKVRHSDTECPKCGTDWDLCLHVDDQWYKRGECASFGVWAAWIEGRYVCSECGIGEAPELKGKFYDQDGKFPCQHCRQRTLFREKPMPPMSPQLPMPVDVSSLPPSGLPLPLGDSVRYVSPRTRRCRLCGGYKGSGHFHGLILAGENP